MDSCVCVRIYLCDNAGSSLFPIFLLTPAYTHITHKQTDVLFLECTCEPGKDIRHHPHHVPSTTTTTRSGGSGEETKEIELTSRNGKTTKAQPSPPPTHTHTQTNETRFTRLAKQASRATFWQRMGSPPASPELVATHTHTHTQAQAPAQGSVSPPRVVRVNIENEAAADAELKTNDDDALTTHTPTPAYLTHTPTQGSTTNNIPLPPSLGVHHSSSSKLENLLPSPEANPFALAFRRSEAYKLFLSEMDALLTHEKEGEEEGEGENAAAGLTTSSSTTTLSAGEDQHTHGATTATATAAGGGNKHAHKHWRTRAHLATRRWCWEVGVLSRRSLLDLTRNPILFLSHIVATTYFAVVLGTVYYNLNMSSLQAIQNRLGAFLLACVFLCFTSVSALPLFWLEKNLYLHEQSNRFYTASAYFVCKVFFDLLPLRVIPTLIFGAVTYGMIGLRPGFQHFVIYEAFLVLLVSTSSIINLIIGMLTRNIMSGILIATIVMIHFLMLTNLFINFESMNVQWLKFLKRVSFFNYAYEGLSENELVGRRLEHFAISTGTGVLHELGFSTTAMYFDLMSLMVYLTVTICVAFVVLKTCVKEVR